MTEQSENGGGNNSMTVRTNLAGGRGSMGSAMDDNVSANYYYEELQHNGGRASPHAVLSQRFFDQ